MSSAMSMGWEIPATWMQIIQRGDTQDLIDGRGLPRFDPNLQSVSCGSPLRWAIDCCREGMAVRLLQLGADVTEYDICSRETLAHRAVKRGASKMLHILLQHGAPADVADAQGMTPLHWAAKLGHRWAATDLLIAGARPGARDEHRRTPSMLALSHGHFDVACDLMKTAGTLHVDAQGLTELHMAAHYADLRSVDVALDLTPDACHLDNFGRNAVHHAVLGGLDRVVLRVVARGVDHCQRDNAGQRPIDYLSEAPRMQREAIRQSLELRPCSA